ncbi:MAG: ABC transporter permease [Clostridiaceae bacterium]|jgi:cell division transport system permease protein|nr:ABC transporter permease [Clostridiaceae bacterium]
MKIRTIKYMISEGFTNTYKNLLMSLASVSMVIASLLIFGIFLMITINLIFNLNQIQKDVEIDVFLKRDVAIMEADAIELKIKNDERVLRYERLSKEQTFYELVAMLEEDSRLLEGLTPDFLYEQFRIHLKDPADSEVFSNELSTMAGIDDIVFPQELVNKMSLILRWTNVGTVVVLVVLLIISVSIIANTIKLTVYARRKEIGIMKYVGANDWFIRWPFIIEGMIIGLFGAVSSFVITSYLYNEVEAYVNQEAAAYGISNVLRIVPLGTMYAQILFVYVIIGLVMGAVGSIISVRKHLNV